MKWQKEPPTVPGIYWYMPNNGIGVAEIVRVYGLGHDLTVERFELGRGRFRPISLCTGMWWPKLLTEPKE